MDIESIRKDTKGLSDKFFFNSAGSSLMPKIVVESMINYFNQEEQWGGYEVANRSSELFECFYEETAKLLNCKPSNIAFTTSATDAYAKALSCIPFKEGDCIITRNEDYISNHITFVSLQKKLNVKVVRMKNLSNNELDLEDLERLVKEYHPKLIAVTHVPTNSGLIQNVEGVGKICRQYDIIYMVDACQSVGQMVVDVQKINCDFLTATGRKFMRGPRGTGFLYISDKILEQNYAPLFLDMRGIKWSGHDDYELINTARRFEHWEISYGSLLGLLEAVKYANNVGMDHIESYNKKLSKILRENLQSNGFKIMDKGINLSSIITFCGRNESLDTIQKVLRENNVFFSLSYKESAVIDFTKKNVDELVVRLSPHYFNTLEEIESISKILESI
ncbi:aminotransferase class V-fold PLP-dependent enzyme [Chryseobacterium nematophagum]|uniref:Aminotransferase class V-fold PLP-dependent enzyme n=1 Tax=Chryseobacterium nematophagum TaxID=2305228 RepID=A0A3M7TJU2_9FLAO|nr:aminotransferase class V-fold PLP-dependent enzyme [Chryseobacterium nematophagum]RNA62460.1 aminotransferase class V-fold PLP-dependent enzyme [Chryseobacterium nematophagum]